MRGINSYTHRGTAALLFVLLGMMLRSVAAELDVTGLQMDGAGRLEVTVRMPAGFRHAVLEIHSGPAPSPVAPNDAGQMDGRAGSATFRLPRPAESPSALARVRASADVNPPAVELRDPTLLQHAL